jgi:hypothetical protein
MSKTQTAVPEIKRVIICNSAISSTGLKKGVMAASSAVAASRKHQKKQEGEIVHVDINAVSLLPEKKDWIAEQNLQMLMLNG